MSKLAFAAVNSSSLRIPESLRAARRVISSLMLGVAEAGRSSVQVMPCYFIQPASEARSLTSVNFWTLK